MLDPDAQLIGQDVYGGCKLDYTGMDVTMDNFFKVLHGDASAKGARHSPIDSQYHSAAENLTGKQHF